MRPEILTFLTCYPVLGFFARVKDFYGVMSSFILWQHRPAQDNEFHHAAGFGTTRPMPRSTHFAAPSSVMVTTSPLRNSMRPRRPLVTLSRGYFGSVLPSPNSSAAAHAFTRLRPPSATSSSNSTYCIITP